MKLLFVGSRSAQSAASLAALLASNASPDMLFIDGPDSGGYGADGRLPPLITAEDYAGVLELAAAHGIAATSGSSQQLQQIVQIHRPERVLVSCYPHRISPALLESVPFGWLNIHPSLLPDYRGVNPIFWQLRDGQAGIGVTLHRMNRLLDLGPIIDQGSFELTDFPDYIEICRRVGRCGVGLFLAYLENYSKGWSNESKQDAESGSRQGHPRPEDFAIDPDWSARRVVRFVKGVRGLGVPFLETHAGRDPIQDASLAASGHSAQPLPGERLIHCYDGSVVLRVLTRRGGESSDQNSRG